MAVENKITVSLVSKDTAKISLSLSDDSGSVVASATDISPVIKFITTGPAGPPGDNASVGNNSITSAKIANGAVTGAKLGSSAVTTTKINNGAVTNQKIGDSAVTANKIASIIGSYCSLHERAPGSASHWRASGSFPRRWTLQLHLLC